MANVLVPKYAMSTDATTFRVTEIVGAYDADTNEGGWGAPNEELANCAIFMIVARKASDADQYMEAKTVSVTYDPTAANDKETVLEFVWKNDGVVDVTVGFLNASENGTTYKADDSAIGEGEYFYFVDDENPVRKMVSGEAIVVTDINELLEDDDTIQTLKTDILEPRLALVLQKLYKQYFLKVKRCQDAKDLFKETQDLFNNIRGSFYTFFCGLDTDAQTQVEALIAQYQIVDQ